MVDERRKPPPLDAFRGASERDVAKATDERVGELGGSVCFSRELQGKVGAGTADRLVAGQGVRELVVAGELAREHDGILDRLGGALTDSGGGRMGGVAEQHEPTLAPARERVEEVDIVSQDRVVRRRVQNPADR
jgi:hypothetical protein